MKKAENPFTITSSKNAKVAWFFQKTCKKVKKTENPLNIQTSETADVSPLRCKKLFSNFSAAKLMRIFARLSGALERPFHPRDLHSPSRHQNPRQPEQAGREGQKRMIGANGRSAGFAGMKRKALKTRSFFDRIKRYFGVFFVF